MDNSEEKLEEQFYKQIELEQQLINNEDLKDIDEFILNGTDKNEILCIACNNGILKIVKYIISNYTIDQYYGAFRNASINSHLKIVKYLIKKVDNKREYCTDALDWACLFEQLKAVKYLIKKGADINNCIITAVRSGNLEIVKYLIRKGVEIKKNYKYNFDDYEKRDPINEAINKGHYDIVYYLKNYRCIRKLYKINNHNIYNINYKYYDTNINRLIWLYKN